MAGLKYFQGVKFTRRHIYIEQTGAKIAWDMSLLRSAWSVLKFNLYIAFMRARQKHGALQKTIAFHPQKSGPWYNSWLAARLLGMKTSSEIASADYVFAFDDSTHSEINPLWPPAAINGKAADISKRYVGQIFKQVFGYDLTVDPLTYRGEMAEKSDFNGLHDGRVARGPLALEDIKEDCIYQKLIDTRARGPQTEDLRAVCIMGEIAVVFHKFKALEKRFGTTYAQVDVIEADSCFSAQEQSDILAFCEAMDVDFGALDILRDIHDGRIYIVDVNKTGMPVLSLSLKEQVKAFEFISASFKRGLSAIDHAALSEVKSG